MAPSYPFRKEGVRVRVGLELEGSNRRGWVRVGLGLGGSETDTRAPP